MALEREALEREVVKVTLYQTGTEVTVRIRAKSDADGFVELPLPSDVADNTIWATAATAEKQLLTLIKDSSEKAEDVGFESWSECIAANLPHATVGFSAVLGMAGRMAVYTDEANRSKAVSSKCVTLSNEAVYTKKRRVKTERLRVQWGVPNVDAVLELRYVTTAIRWSPRYHVDVQNDKAVVTMVAQINNTSDEKFEDVAEVEFATHMPQTSKTSSAFSSNPSPSKQPRTDQKSDESSARYASRGLAAAASAAAAAGPAEVEDAVESGDERDAFTLKANKLAIYSGATSYSLFRVTLPAILVYKTNDEKNYQARFQVWRHVQLTNNSGRTLMKSSDACVFLHGTLSGGSLEFPRLVAENKGTLRLHESSDVAFNVNQNILSLVNNSGKPVLVELSQRIPAMVNELQGLPESLTSTLQIDKERYSNDITTLVSVTGTLPPGTHVVTGVYITGRADVVPTGKSRGRPGRPPTCVAE